MAPHRRTPTVSAILSLFSCVSVDSRPRLSPLPSDISSFVLSADVRVRCYTGHHLIYVIAIGIPGLLLICLGVPAFVIVCIHRMQGQLDTPHVSARWSFMYLGYRADTASHESLILLRKLSVAAINALMPSADDSSMSLRLMATITIFFLAHLVQARSALTLSGRSDDSWLQRLRFSIVSRMFEKQPRVLVAGLFCAAVVAAFTSSSSSLF